MSGKGLFFVELLEAEKRYDDIFKQINTGYTTWLSQKDIADILKVSATYYPHQTLAAIVKQTQLLLDTGQRSRSIYQPIASWFKALKDIPNLEKGTKMEARQIEAKYNRLNALKEELRGAGVV